MKLLADRRNSLMEKRRRRADREGTTQQGNVEQEGILATTS